MKKTAEKSVKTTESEQSEQEKLLNVSQLAFRFDLDRGTVRARLRDVAPDSEKANEKLYRLERVVDLLVMSEAAVMDAVKLQKLQAEADLKTLTLEKERGETASVAEFTEVVQRVFGSLHKKLAVQLPKRLAKKLKAAKSDDEISKILSGEISKIFDELRADYKKFLT